MGRRIIRESDATDFLLPPSVEEWVDEAHPARFIRDLVEQLDVETLGIKQPNSRSAGGTVFAPELLLKVWLYGFFTKLRSSRKLEQACRENLAMIWLCGMQAPDHNTIWRFWKNNKKAMELLFKNSVRVALKADLISLTLQALDGTKFQAACSSRTTLYKKKLQKIEAQLDQAIADITCEIEASNKQDSKKRNVDLPQRLQGQKARREEIREALKLLEEEGRDSLHPDEKDARTMLHNDGRKKPSYNAQAVVEENNGLLVAVEISTNSHDANELNPMLEEVEENLGVTAATTVADSAYGRSETQLVEAEKNKRNVLTNRQKDESRPFHKSQFHLDRNAKKCFCPIGKELEYRRQRTREKHSDASLIFQCPHFQNCPHRKHCCKGENGRQVEFSPHHETLQHHREQAQSESGKQKLKRRAVIVEPVFGRIKHNEEFRRFTVRGKENVSAQWNLIALIHNLRIIYRHWKVRLQQNFGKIEIQTA